MKNYSELLPGNAATSLAMHRAVQGRFEVSKITSHRYERRRVREYLRHADREEEVIGAESSFAR